MVDPAGPGRCARMRWQLYNIQEIHACKVLHLECMPCWLPQGMQNVLRVPNLAILHVNMRMHSHPNSEKSISGGPATHSLTPTLDFPCK